MSKFKSFLDALRFKYRHMRSFEIQVAYHCNLNCKGCSHYSPLSEERFISPEELRQHLSVIRPRVRDFFTSVRLLGGEPLLNPRISEIIQVVHSFFPKQQIKIISNGTLLMKMPSSFWEVCKEYNVFFNITFYPVSLDFAKIENIFLENNIEYLINYEQINNFRHDVIDEKGGMNPLRNYYNCKYGGICMQFREGRLYPCAHCAYIDIVNKSFNTKIHWRYFDTLDFRRVLFKWQIFLFAITPKPFCRYCNLDKQSVTTWGISKRDKSEWF